MPVKQNPANLIDSNNSSEKKKRKENPPYSQESYPAIAQRNKAPLQIEKPQRKRGTACVFIVFWYSRKMNRFQDY